ncbi:Hypothetical protein R9X50_00711600 [Acrodontium crateriforme]|uniref:Peptidase S9 prolyl oligopeptidase catalytic domain-containing protein n=1 Tax=Acrodontium crateriforme TaxID=150365 RepID=A0AAQ3M959_9PEZI|nr:Hypothetical protein R9X50_00711600 [Acrodontium crateriforme]
MLSRGWQYFTQYAGAVQTFLGESSAPCSDVSFAPQWQVLGPFQIGTREAVWGADPLELYGGFRALEYSQNATYRSSLAFNGTVNWSHVQADLGWALNDCNPIAELIIGFPDVDWSFLQDVYGWSAMQWQGWARGEIRVDSTESKVFSLYLENIIEIWVDGQHYFGGDFYGFHRAPVTIRLEPGKHRIDVRLVRDVRAMGGVGRPDIKVSLELQESDGLLQPPQRSGQSNGEVLLADVAGEINGPLNSPYGSATVRNDAQRDIHVVSMRTDPKSCESELIGAPIKLVPGQSRPLAFRISCVPPVTGQGAVPIEFDYQIESEIDVRSVTFYTSTVARSFHDAQKITYMHPGGIVSYALLRPPHPSACPERRNESLPILLQLHGAGVDADSDMVRHQLDDVPHLCAWVLFPTGVTQWSGDDWHNWGFADVEAAVAAIPDWIERVQWKGPGVDINRWMVSGHSNGGQGTWYTVTHHPDKVFAAVAASGYSSIQNYVPYTFWGIADPGRTAVVQAALNSYRHELLLENVKDIPLLMQHGGNDDNVPAYHARLLNQKLEQVGVESTLVEVPNEPHWWDGIMTTKTMANFYNKHLEAKPSGDVPFNIKTFTVVSANNGDSGPKNGVQILTLKVPGQIGKVHITFDPVALTCTFYTSNVQSLSMPPWMRECEFVFVDGQHMNALEDSSQDLRISNEGGKWQSTGYLPPLTVRKGRQLGTIDSILRTEGVFQIVPHSKKVGRVAVQISRNLFQYFAADAVITEDYEDAKQQTKSNVISIAIGADLPRVFRGNHAFEIIGDQLQIEDHEGQLRRFPSRPNGLAAVFLRPLLGERLELIVWAADIESLDIAARLVPLMTGAGLPDFIVADKSMLGKGIEGTLAMGFLDGRWKVSRNSFFA